MRRAYRRIDYCTALDEPLTTCAHVAEADGSWRLLMFPGTPSRKYLFERMLRLAPPDLEVVLMTRPGFGSGHRRAYLAFEDQIAAAAPFLDGDKKVVALGVSYGGALALKALLDHPQAVKGAVTVAALVTEPRPWVQSFVDLGGASAVRPLLRRTWRHAQEEVVGRRPQVGPLFARLKEVRAPVTIVHGDADHLVSRKDAATLKGYFAESADVELREVRGGTHFLELQHPRLLFDAVQGVIARAQGGAKSAAGASAFEASRSSG